MTKEILIWLLDHDCDVRLTADEYRQVIDLNRETIGRALIPHGPLDPNGHPQPRGFRHQRCGVTALPSSPERIDTLESRIGQIEKTLRSMASNNRNPRSAEE